jgi:hypothetical protein
MAWSPIVCIECPEWPIVNEEGHGAKDVHAFMDWWATGHASGQTWKGTRARSPTPLSNPHLAWTVSDLAGRDKPGRDELAIALAMRRGEQPGTVQREVG